MSFKICKGRVYEYRNEKGRRIPDYIIKNNYDGRFLEWIDINPTGIKEVDENIGYDGSVIVHKRSHAEAIIEKLEITARSLNIKAALDSSAKNRRPA